MRVSTHACPGQPLQEWGLPYCKYYGPLKQNDSSALIYFVLVISVFCYFSQTRDE